jgi:hypothetical protein
MAEVRPATAALRKRIVAVLREAGGQQVSTPQLCQRAGFNNFEHHAYVLPQRRALARVGVITRDAPSPGRAVYWRINPTDQTDAAINAQLETRPTATKHTTPATKEPAGSSTDRRPLIRAPR